jgi:hypothetical protein
MDYTPEQRQAAAPWTTLDVPESELIVRGNSKGPMMSVSKAQAIEELERRRVMKGGEIKGYRGVSSANKAIDPNITWFSESEDLARGYSDRGEVFSRDLQTSNAFDAGDDKTITTPRMFIDKALQEKPLGKVSDMDALLIKEDFLANYGDPDKKVNVLDFWSSDDGKDTVANAFVDLGYNSIKIKEEGVDTFGAIRLGDGG